MVLFDEPHELRRVDGTDGVVCIVLDSCHVRECFDNATVLASTEAEIISLGRLIGLEPHDGLIDLITAV